MRMKQLTIYTMILILWPIFVMADDGVNRLRVITENLLATQALTMAQKGQDLVMEGDIVVERIGDYYAITTPFLRVQEKGQEWVIGMLAMNAAPISTNPKQWQMAVAIPTPITLQTRDGGQVLTTIELSDQSTNIIYDEAKNSLVSVRANLGPIGATLIVRGMAISIGRFGYVYEGQDIAMNAEHILGRYIAPDGQDNQFLSMERYTSRQKIAADTMVRTDELVGIDVDWQGYAFGLGSAMAKSAYDIPNKRLAVTANAVDLQTDGGEIAAPFHLKAKMAPVNMADVLSVEKESWHRLADHWVIEDMSADFPHIGVSLTADLKRSEGTLLPVTGSAELRLAGAEGLIAHTQETPILGFLVGFMPLISLMGQADGVDAQGRAVTQFTFQARDEGSVNVNNQNVTTLLSVITGNEQTEQDDNNAGNP